MATFRLVFGERLGTTPISSISFCALDAELETFLAQYRDCPAELWMEDNGECTLVRSGRCGELWSNAQRRSNRIAGVDFEPRLVAKGDYRCEALRSK